MMPSYSTQFKTLAQRCYGRLYDLLADNGAMVKFNNDRNDIKVVVMNWTQDHTYIIEVSSIYIDWDSEEIRFTSTEPTIPNEYYTFDDLIGLELWAFLYEVTKEELENK